MATCRKLAEEVVLRLSAKEAELVRALLNAPLTWDGAGIDEALRGAGVRL